MENSQLKTIKEKVSSKDKDGLKPRFLDQLYNLLEVKFSQFTRVSQYQCLL